MLLVGFIIVGLVFKLSKYLISKFISVFILVFIIFGAYTSYVHNINNPIELLGQMYTDSKTTITNLIKNVSEDVNPEDESKPPAETQHESTHTESTDNSAILNQLLEYTNAQSPGPTYNYYWKVGPAQLENSDDIANGEIKYSRDAQGRASIARAKLTYQMYDDSKGSRQGSPLDPPTGWPRNPKVTISYHLDNKVYHGFMFNRSHSIADSLGGKATYTSADNFTVGTRSQNVGADSHGGMRAAEETAENYWKTHPNSDTIIEYQTTPLYNENETVPRGSVVSEKSSDGQINVQFAIINTAEGHVINYMTGDITK